MISRTGVRHPPFWKMPMSESGNSRPPKTDALAPAQNLSGAPCDGASDEPYFHVSPFLFIVFQTRKAVAFWSPCDTHQLA